MKRWFKYDVAISVAEEDKEIAKQIAEKLKREGVRYYYYEELAAENWGKYIIKLTADAFGARTRYVLMITSKVFVQKYWSNIERQVALANPAQDKPHILQLRLDDTAVDGVSGHAVYRNWGNNPEEIARVLKNKIKTQKLAGLRNDIKRCMIVLFLIAAIVLTYVTSRPKPRAMRVPVSVKSMEKMLITGPSCLIQGNAISPETSKIDSFYISNTEVTIAQYREYCSSQKKAFPSQPFSFYENGPVVNVTWYEALEFCKWMQGRLPTETEWEFAAGSGLSVTYSGGNNASKVAVYNRQKPIQVATKIPNKFGLYDMTGNVAEWCDNWSDASARWKAVRGGAYNSKIKPVNELAIDYRTKEEPNARTSYIGFRIAWDKK